MAGNRNLKQCQTRFESNSSPGTTTSTTGPSSRDTNPAEGGDFSGNNHFWSRIVNTCATLLALLLISSLALQICVDFIPSLLSLTKKSTPTKILKNSTTKKVIPVLKNCK